ncbi:hypothetical protein PHYPSEUDO_014735 [Phytophthora pseudosyringae]|uniref:AB hydrolase-1 domain-containing protein n=1 Tax=Phytophthora pseudosyringae TaxID=221518 RepID=A0A8T1W170_9STRA|nr:hypothetical protein PHYPSEUDO_014735 [Phytophthora pseudosyringae]
MKAATMAPVLLFAHGTNFCKEIWRPVERHLKALPLGQRASDVQFVSIDLPYHGAKRDDSFPALVDKDTPTVNHSASKFVTLSTEAIRLEVQQLRAQLGRRPIVGVGHSMGAAALWNVEAELPGTFGGLVLFEPFVEEPGTRDPKIQRYIFNLALNRQHRWETRQAAANYFENVKGFATWDRESLACWLEGAIVPERNGSEAVVLACHPTIEAAIYCGERLWLSESDMSSVACPVSIRSSDDSWLFDPAFFAGIEQKWPRIYKNHPSINHTTHNLIMEKPKECADAIHADLKDFGCFKSVLAKL